MFLSSQHPHGEWFCTTHPLWGLQATPGCRTPWHVQLPHEFNKYTCITMHVYGFVYVNTYYAAQICGACTSHACYAYFVFKGNDNHGTLYIYKGSVEWCEVGGGATYVIWQCLQLFNTHIPLVKTCCSLGPPNTFHAHTYTRQLQHCRQILLSPVGVQLKPVQALGHGLLHTTQVPVVAKQWT